MKPSSETVLRGALWAALVAALAVAAAAGARSLLRPPAAGPARPPAYGQVPAFSLVERSGRGVEAGQLRGVAWVASFIYTRCTDTCPLQSAEMARLQADFAAERDVRLVSITVDPARDTPAVLSAYARRLGADPERWLFLTGDRDAIFRLAREGFRLGVEEASPGPLDRAFPPEGPAPEAGARPAAAQAPARGGTAPGPILHSDRLVLVDRQGRIRGYYAGRDAEGLRRLREHLRIVLRESAG